MADRTLSLNPASPDAASSDASQHLLASASPQDASKPAADHKSYLATAIDAIASPFISNQKTRDTVDQLGSEFVQTASLFAAGKFGLASTLAAYGLGQASPDDKLSTQAEDFALGAAKGGVLKGLYSTLGTMKFAPTKGILMGIASRDTDVLLSRNTFSNPQEALQQLKAETINPQSWLLDAAVWTVGEGSFGVANKLTGGALAENRVISGMFMGSTFGMASGGAGEIMKEKAAGQQLDWGKIAEQTAIQGAINGLAAGTGTAVSAHFEAAAPRTGKNTADSTSDSGIENKAPAPQMLDRLKMLGNMRLPQARPELRVLPAIKPASLIRVESTDVAPLPEYKNPPPKEYRILDGQKALDDFRHYRSDSATLQVRELIGRKLGIFKQYGPAKSMFVQRLGGNEGQLLPEAKTAQIVASCHPENLSAADQANHVFPEGRGKVWMVTANKGREMLLSMGEHPIKVWNATNYSQATRLDGGYTTINVMAPLAIGDPHAPNGDQSKGAWDEFDRQLKIIKQTGVDAVSTDVWWGLVEPNKRQYDWTYYDKVSDHIINAGLKWVPILSFHQCGGNVGDDVNVPLPDWVWSDLASKVHTGKAESVKFKSEYGNTSNEYVSFWADDLAMEHYQALTTAFQDHFASKAKNIGEINVSLGTAGEGRMPSYNSHDGAIAGYPTRGALQLYSDLAKESFQDYALTKYGGIDGVRKAWNMPDLTPDKILPPSDMNGFLGRTDQWRTQYGRDNYDFNNQSLIDHDRRIITSVRDIVGKQGAPFYGIDIGAKIPGVHWRVGEWQNGKIVTGDRLAELNAGLIRTSTDDWWSDEQGHGYRPLLTMFRELQPSRPGLGSRIIPSFTCLEMPDGQDGPGPQSMPHSLARWVGQEAERQGLWIKGENALAGDLYNGSNWDLMRSLLDLPNQDGYYHGLTFLRMGDIVNSDTARAKIAELLHAVRSVDPRRKAA